MSDTPSRSAPERGRLAADAERLARNGQAEAAAQLYAQLLAQAPDDARALSFLAMRAFAAGDLVQAQALIDRAVAGQPVLALAQAQRANVLLARGLREEALQALLAALQIDPEFVPARLDAGLLLDELGRPREAAEHLRRCLERLPPAQAQPPALRTRTERAERVLAREKQALEDSLAERLAPLRERLAPAATQRFDECLDIFCGRKRPKLPKPGATYFPKLPPLTFFPRAMFDWVERAEAATQAVREEVCALLQHGDAGFIPYVQKPEKQGGAGTAWSELNNRTDWGAYFLYNQGQRVERHCAACPATAELLDSLPLVRIPGRAPTAFFSRLKPGTRIPAHHGATNTRVIVHLPLIVPPGCGFRVGNDERAWVPGQALVFDDTIEHEAWNQGAAERVVLIFDVWNPFLTAEECELVAAMTAAVADFHPGVQHDTDA